MTRSCDDLQASYLEGGDADAVAHVASCATCGRVTAALDALREQLGEPAIWDEPGDDLEDRLMAAIHAERPRRQQVTDLADRQRELQRRRQGFWVAAAAAVIVALIATVAVLARLDDVDRRVVLAGTGPQPEASAEVRTRDTSSGIEIRLDASDLPRAPDGFFYEGWMNGPSGLVSIGTFNSGAGTVVLWSGVSLDDYDEITVTLEPEDGDPASSGVRVLAGPIPRN